MYQASKKFGDAIAGSNRKFNTRLLENEKVLVESVKNFTITSGAEEITIGSAVASYVQATIENKGIALSGKEVSLEIGVEVDGEMEYIPMGLYTIQNPKIESNKVTFTAYDRLASRCNGAYYSKLSYPTDAVDILAEISTMTGVAIDTSTLQRGIQINQRAIIEEGDYNEETEESEVITTYVNPFDGYTYKETIGFIAGLFGKFAMCGRTGMIEFRWYQGIDYEIPSNIFYNDLQETEESFSIKRLACDNSDQTLSSGSGATGISMQNPVMTQSILDGVYNTVKGLVFTPTALRFIGDTRLDIGDIVTAVKNDSTKFTIPIISLITSYDGGLMQTIASYGNTAEEDDSDTKGPITEMAERVEYELAFVKKLMVDNLTATNATIKNLSGDVLKFKTGEFETLKTDVANFKQTFTDDLQASNAKINTLESDHATFKEATATNLNATNARIANIEADYLKATDAKLTYATITNLNTTNAEITKLKTKDAEIDKLVATKATITDLNAAVGRVGVLESSYANLNTLVNGNLTSDNIQNLTLTSKNTTIENGMIKNAMIENLSFDKITGMDINTTNLTVHSSDGKSKWSDNTIQISDANRVRVQIGKDASNDYSMSVWDKNGNLIWDALGATEKTIQRKIIRDGIVADDANISGSKLDINSVIKEVNGSTTKLKSSTIVMNDKNQTLDVVFNEMETTVADNLSSAKLYADGKLSDAQKYALEQANSALSSAKSYVDSSVDNLEIGGRNLFTYSTLTDGDPVGKCNWGRGYINNSKHIGYTSDGFHFTTDSTGIDTSNGVAFVIDRKKYGLKTGDTVTFSVDVKGTVGTGEPLIQYWASTSTDSHFWARREFGDSLKEVEKDTYNRYKVTVTLRDVHTSAYNTNITDYFCVGGGFNADLYVRHIKLEKGTKATDYTPAQEDTQSQIDNITEITTSHTTSISTMQGQISSLISEDTTIKGNYNALLSRYNATVETVDSMKTTIGEHTTILNSQNDSITSVTTKANTIESNLAGTTQTVSEVKSNLAGTQERVTKVETSLSGLTTRVSATEAKYDNLEIGGRNLLRDADTMSTWIKGTKLAITYGQSDPDGGSKAIKIVNSEGTYGAAWIEPKERHTYFKSGQYTYSFYAKSDAASGSQIQTCITGNYTKVFDLTTTWKRYTYTITIANDLNTVDMYWFNFVGKSAIYFYHPKLETGNKATDFTIAPEDTNQQITAAETVATQTADKFNWLVKSGTNSTDFELTDRAATLVASAINMKGLVTFNGLNTDAKNEIGKVAQSKVDGLEVGGRNLARGTSNEYSTPYTNFNGSANTCFDIGRVYLDDLKAGDTITVHMYIKHDNLVAASGKTIQMWLQGYGNVTLWNGGSFPSTLRPSFSGSGVYELLYSVALDSYHEKNQYWVCGIRTDYIQSGSVQVKSFKVEKGNKATDWTPAPEDYLPQASLVSNWTTNTTWIDGSKIYTGSITADKIATDAIRSKNYVANSTGSFLNLADGTFDSKYLKWDASGNITAKGGTIGKYKITDQWLVTGSGSTCTGIGGNQAFWAGAESSDSAPFRVGYDGKFVSSNADISGKISATSGKVGKYEITDTYLKTGSGSTCSGFGSDYAFWAGNDEAKYAPFKVEYDGTLNIEHIVVHGDQEDVYMKIGKDYLTIQDVNTSAHFGLDGFDFAWANSRITTGDQGIELYGDTPYIDFHYDNRYSDYTSRIIADSSGCLHITDSLAVDTDIHVNNGYIYNSTYGHYSWWNKSHCYISCNSANGTDNVYYYAGYHAFYVNSDSGSGMVYINKNGAECRKGFRNTSDERTKKDFKHFDDDFIKSYMQLEPIKYRFKDDADEKYHIGFTAQNVDKTLNTYGKNHDEQFGTCVASHINQDYAEKAYGIKDMNEVYTLAYDELIGANTFMIQKTRKDLLYQAGKIDIHEAIINDLQFKIAKMEKKIEQLTKALA